MHAIVASDLHKSYRRGTTVTPVLRGADFRVRVGEAVFLIGPSGSGKSTLLSILGCLLTPDLGQLEILGHAVETLSAREATELRLRSIGFVFQRFQLIDGLSALDNVCIPLKLAGWPAGKARRRAAELLECVGLADHLRARPGRMSAGQCQRVAIARALALEPPLILADEPTASLDAQSGQEIMTLFQSLMRDHQVTAVVVTHDPRIFSFADRICEVVDGRVRATEAVA